MGGATAPAAPLHSRRPPNTADPDGHPTLPPPESAEIPPTPAALAASLATSPDSGPRIVAAATTHPGLLRDNNEDSLLLRAPDDAALLLSRGTLFAVADGVGGQNAGEIASRVAVDVLAQEYYSPRAPHQIETALRQALQAANLSVYNQAHGPDAALRMMQTTLAVVVLAGRQAYVGHAGDTRVYLARSGAVSQLTSDHSEAAELLKLRLITPEQANVHPRRSVLTRALGASPLMRPDFQRAPLQAGDRFLICTDGLWGELPVDALRDALLAAPPGEAEQACAGLLTLALERGGSDNVSHVVVDVLDPGPAAPAAPAGAIRRLLTGLRGG
ncbi:MAG TPA: protein phosphatase 2C domain-containing protein [Chloroflexota bacterium]|nr:protein phosphatase 2C domain-containing protein [Chloroflexota bacterium]